MRLPFFLLPLALAALLPACVEWPDIDVPGGAEPGVAGWPALVPVDQILAGAPTGAAPAGPPAGRLAALRARAARLRGPVIDPATRARMARGVDTHPFPPPG